MGMPLAVTPFDRAAYFDWEAQQVGKHEFFAGEAFAMVGARQDHVVVSLALASRLRDHLRGSRCRTYTSDMKLEVEVADAIFYPDVMVSCDAEDRQRPLALRAPCLIVEVLSDSTAAFDRGAKFAAYRQLASLQEVLFVDIDARRLELYQREAEGWLLSEIRQGASSTPADTEAALALRSIDLRLRCTDAFEDLDAAAA